jgi:acetylornithine/N-succinyldiaminopimelate aminotransferase
MLSSNSENPIINSYNRANITFSHGLGSELYDCRGQRYIDFLAGIAVLTLGHSDPSLLEVLTNQSQKLIHVSNLFWNEPAIELGRKLRNTLGWGQSFFCNSGTEANECAIKLARRWGNESGRYKIISAFNSFHGRTYGALAATGQANKSSMFQPLPEGFYFADFNDLDSFAKLVDGETAAVILEPIQGEGGIIPADINFLLGIRELCDRQGCLLIFDEIQCGMGRTGKMWSYQGVNNLKPDILTTAKGLGGGLPIGACIAAQRVADVLKPGEHGSTFGGGPLVTKVAGHICDRLDSSFLKTVISKGELIVAKLSSCLKVKVVRGCGLMIGVVLHEDNAVDIATKVLSKGLIVNAVRPNVIRLTPALNISTELLNEGLAILSEVIEN